MTDVWQDGILRERWDDGTRLYTAWDEMGAQIDQRPYTAAENADADARAAAAQLEANETTIASRLVTVDMPAMQAIIDQANADLRADPSQEIKNIARAVRRLARKVETLFDSTD